MRLIPQRQLNDGPTGKSRWSRLFIYLFTYLFIYLFIHSFIYLIYFATGIYENETEK